MSRFSRPGWRALAGVVATALLFGLYALGGIGHLLGFVLLVPWLLALDGGRSGARAVLSGWAMSVAFVAAVLAWFGVAIATYTGLHGAIGVAVVLIAAPLLQPQFLAFALVRHLAGRRHGPVLRALAAACAWVAVEWLYPKLLGDTFGHGLAPSPWLRQFADVGGAAGLTFLLILTNEAIAAAIVRRRDGARAMVRPLAVAVAIVALMAGYGAVRLSMLDTAPAAGDKPLRMGLVQTNIVDYDRLRREMGAYGVVRHVLDTHYAMSHEAVEQHGVDALLWSETVYPTTFGHPKSEAGAELDREIQHFISAAGVPLVFGTYDIDADGEYNAAGFLEPIPIPLTFYRKTRLFLLTEHVPAWLDGPTLRRALPWAGTWRSGDGARVFPLRLADGREIPVLPMICLDDVDTGLGIDGARLGARVILGLSNDSWFTAHPTGANLHLTVATFRSIETRLPQLRVTSNGISAAIDARGEVLARTAMGERKLLIGEAAIGEPPATLMVAWGDWVGRAACVLLLLLSVSPLMAFLRRRGMRGATVPAAGQTADLRIAAVVLTPAWRIAAGLLQAFAWGSLLWIGIEWVAMPDAQPNPLTRIWRFAGLFLAPSAAAWCIARAFVATVRIEGDALVLEQRERRIEIPLANIAAVEPWMLPLPTTGAWLRLGSGRRWSHGIALADVAGLVDALVRAGARPAFAEVKAGPAALMRVRSAVPRWRIDHPLVKFVLFPMVPAIPAFRLHQQIAFGGPFGEYYTYGLQAYVVAFLIWWASWAIGLVLFAAALRIGIEAGTALSLLLRRARAADVRAVLEAIGRLSFFVGVPVWLLLRLLSA
jgi:apolipoprotein N-acyltransferase